MAKNKKEEVKCSICGKIIQPNKFGWEFGNSAYPINDGTCCDKCNIKYVIPARMENKKV